ncbi:hypothetical protein K2173_020435 [Erythroxylum novogranatense]|uniref:Uncharacterized protein n=1 Tax=Erythroxylum novogranatense TaxID=1862640 RepID=A0AAV8TIE1_9ROSI|nr:hypothetical protein K2173_020435 [Erythroxylum novogranatense]
MHDFSGVDGFVEITESLAEMIKYVVNDPSVGLFYIQQHTQNAVPNLISLKSNVAEKSRETNLHTEDLEDTITMTRSMKECGFPIADEMITNIRRSLATMSTKQPKRGLIQAPTSSFQKTLSWKLGNWGYNGAHLQRNSQRMSSYFSTVFINNFKLPYPDARELTVSHYEQTISNPSPQNVAESISTSSSAHDIEAGELTDELPLLSHTSNEQPGSNNENLEAQVDENLRQPYISPVSENFDNFKAENKPGWRSGCERLSIM